jgi:hypothetical protein
MIKMEELGRAVNDGYANERVESATGTRCGSDALTTCVVHWLAGDRSTVLFQKSLVKCASEGSKQKLRPLSK